MSAPLALGCAPIGNMFEVVDDDEAVAVITAAYDAGIRLFDTAPLYGHGLSERRLGKALSIVPRDAVTISTKVGRVLVPDDESGQPASIFTGVPPVHPEFDFSADGVRRSLDASLERLGVDRVDIVHVHDPDDHIDGALRGAFPALRQLRDEGVIDKVGAGMNQAPALARFVREAGVDCVLLAGRYTLLDQSGLDELLPLCEQEGVGVLAAGVFNSGLLANPSMDSTFFYQPAPAEAVARAQELSQVCERHRVPLIAAAIQYPKTHPAVTHVLTGVRSLAELQANLAAYELPIPEALWAELGVPRG